MDRLGAQWRCLVDRYLRLRDKGESGIRKRETSRVRPADGIDQ